MLGGSGLIWILRSFSRLTRRKTRKTQNFQTSITSILPKNVILLSCLYLKKKWKVKVVITTTTTTTVPFGLGFAADKLSAKWNSTWDDADKLAWVGLGFLLGCSLFICGAADRSGRGKCCSCCCCWGGGTIFQVPMYSFLGCEKAKTLSQKGCEKAKKLSQKGCEKAKTLSQKGYAWKRKNFVL